MRRAIGLGVSAAATWFLRVISDRTQRRFRDRVTVALESHVAQTAGVGGHHRASRASRISDRLAMLRNQVFVLDHMYMSLFSTCGWILRLGVTLALLVSIHPALALLAVFALPTVLTSTWRPGVERAAKSAALGNRLARHLFDLGDHGAAGQGGAGDPHRRQLVRERRAAWERWYGPVAAARWASASGTRWGGRFSVCAYVGAVVFVSSELRRTPGSVLLVLAAGSRLSAYIGATVGEIGFLRGFWLDGSRRLAWLEDYAASLSEHADAAAPGAAWPRHPLRACFIRLSRERTDCVLEDVNLEFKPGSVVAIVGENGAGKSTLVKLLCRMYQPTRVASWWTAWSSPACRRTHGGRGWPGHFRISSGSSFGRARQSASAICRGLTTSPAVLAAVERAGAADVVEHLPAGLETQLGPTWPAAWRSASASGRSWPWRADSCAIIRWSWCWTSRPRRSTPRPSTRCSSATPRPAGRRTSGRTRGRPHHDPGVAPVQHRADGRSDRRARRLAGGRSGTHEELVDRGGQYSEFYGIQAEGYR